MMFSDGVPGLSSSSPSLPTSSSSNSSASSSAAEIQLDKNEILFLIANYLNSSESTRDIASILSEELVIIIQLC